MELKSIKELINKIKEESKEYICFVKVGGFYLVFNIDAMYFEEVYGLKRTCFSKGICKVGVPINSLNKYIGKLKENNISFKVYDYTDKEDYIYIVGKKKYKLLCEYAGVSDFKLLTKDCSNCKYNSDIVNYDKIDWKLILKDLVENLNNGRYNKK